MQWLRLIIFIVCFSSHFIRTVQQQQPQSGGNENRNFYKSILQSSQFSFDLPNVMKRLMNEKDLYTIEYTLARLEAKRMVSLASTLASQGYEITGFYHTSKWQNYWSQVIAEQLFLLDGKRKLPYRYKYSHGPNDTVSDTILLFFSFSVSGYLFWIFTDDLEVNFQFIFISIHFPNFLTFPNIVSSSSLLFRTIIQAASPNLITNMKPITLIRHYLMQRMNGLEKEEDLLERNHILKKILMTLLPY